MELYNNLLIYDYDYFKENFEFYLKFEGDIEGLFYLYNCLEQFLKEKGENEK